MKARSIVALAGALVIAGASHAANVAAGKAKVEQVCSACHGVDGISWASM